VPATFGLCAELIRPDGRVANGWAAPSIPMRSAGEHDTSTHVRRPTHAPHPSAIRGARAAVHVVAFGGRTGLPVLLAGLRECPRSS